MMGAMIRKSNGLWAINDKIAQSYDHVPYDPQALPDFDPEWLFGMAALHGVEQRRTEVDVLDLGCGTGSQLERAASMCAGRLVGTDLSQSACERAAERVGVFGDRAEIRCADFLDLDCDDLGQFDLIYHIGVLYVIPEEVRTRVLALIGQCLKPGGVAVISYHTGAIPLLTAGIHRALRACKDESLPVEEQIRAGRARLHEIEGWLSRIGGDHSAMRTALQRIDNSPDVVFFHEMLNERYSALSTAALHAELSDGGVHFLNWVYPGPFGEIARAADRAIAADAWSFGGGGYHCAVFAKCDGVQPASARSADLLWETHLTRIETQSGEATFSDGSDNYLTIVNPVTEAALELLSLEPRRYADLCETLEQTFAGQREMGTVDSVLNRNLVALWQQGLARARWVPGSTHPISA